MGESIREWGFKIKAALDSREVGDFLVVLLVILVGAVSFGLGRLSAGENSKGPGVSFTEDVAVERPPMALGGMVVASRQGSRYHFPWCAGASQIVERNRIWFADEEEARRGGYTPARNCKGLK